MHTRRLFFWDVSIRNSLRSKNIFEVFFAAASEFFLGTFRHAAQHAHDKLLCGPNNVVFFAKLCSKVCRFALPEDEAGLEKLRQQNIISIFRFLVIFLRSTHACVSDANVIRGITLHMYWQQFFQSAGAVAYHQYIIIRPWCVCFSVHSITHLALLLSLPPTVVATQIRGHVASSSPSSPRRFVPRIFSEKTSVSPFFPG